MMEMEKTETLEKTRGRAGGGREEDVEEDVEGFFGITRMERISKENLKGITCVRCSGG